MLGSATAGMKNNQYEWDHLHPHSLLTLEHGRDLVTTLAMGCDYRRKLDDDIFDHHSPIISKVNLRSWDIMYKCNRNPNAGCPS